jgi:PAS domain S-box-containing protein
MASQTSAPGGPLQELRATTTTELMYRTTIDAIDSLIYVVDRELRITLFNKGFTQWCQKQDLKIENIIGLKLQEIFPFLSQTEKDEYQGVFSTAKVSVTQETTTVNSNKITTETRKIPIMDGDKVSRVVTVVTDISDRKQAEQLQSVMFRISEKTSTSRDLNQLYRAIHQLLAELVEINNFYIALYDRKNEMIEFPYFIDQKDPPHKSRRMKNGLTEYVLRSGNPLLLTKETTPSFEENHKIELIGSDCAYWLGIPLTTSTEETFGALVVQSYCDEVRYTEREKEILMFVSQQIATAIERKRTEEMLRKTEAEFHKLQKIETIGTLVGSIAHDYNNILSTILGNAQLMEFSISDNDHDLKKYVKAIIQASQNGAGLVRQLLSFTRNEETPLETIDLNKFISDWGEILTQVAGDSIKVDTSLDPNLYPFKGNREKISQVIMNLVINAKESMPCGGTIGIETTNTDLKEKQYHQNTAIKPGSYVCIRVKDTGVGIEESMLREIFKPFVSKGKKGKGTGLGLSIVKRIVDEMKGFIGVDSQTSKGTVMSIYIPWYESLEVQPVEPYDQSYTRGQGELLLLVEDHNEVRNMMRNILEQHLGYGLLEATNGKEALRVLQQNQVSLVVTDIKMPEMDGITLMEEIKKNFRYLKNKVIAITAFSENDDDTLRETGFRKVIQKPIKISDLSRAIDIVLNSDSN